MRDIMYHEFHREYFDSKEKIDKYPEPAERERAMRVHWIMDFENKYPAHLWNVDTTRTVGNSKKDDLRGVSDQMHAVIEEYGDRAWQIYTPEEEVLRVEESRLDRMPQQEISEYDPEAHTRSPKNPDRGRGR